MLYNAPVKMLKSLKNILLKMPNGKKNSICFH